MLTFVTPRSDKEGHGVSHSKTRILNVAGKTRHWRNILLRPTNLSTARSALVTIRRLPSSPLCNEEPGVLCFHVCPHSSGLCITPVALRPRHTGAHFLLSHLFSCQTQFNTGSSDSSGTVVQEVHAFQRVLGDFCFLQTRVISYFSQRPEPLCLQGWYETPPFCLHDTWHRKTAVRLCTGTDQVAAG